jgi:ABC-type amino acid transport substrate-binding protein
MRWIKYYLSVLLFLLIIVSATAQFSGTSFPEAQKTKKAKLVCLYSKTPGYISTDDQNKIKGLLPEIMNAFAGYLKKKHTIDANFQYEPFKNNTPLNDIFKTVNNANDGVIGLIFIFITEERKKTLNFSSSIFESPSYLITSNTVSDITSTKEIGEKLKGYTAYVNKGNLYEDRFNELKSKYIPDLKVDYLKTYGTSNITEILNKEKSVQYVDVSGLLYLVDNKIPMKNHKFLQLSIPMGIIFPQKNSWTAEFNIFLGSGFLKSSEFKKMVADNLGLPTMRMLKL